MQTVPQIPAKELTSLYTNYYPRRDADLETMQKKGVVIPDQWKIFEYGLETSCHYQTKKGDRVLDIGCGTCQSLLEIQKLGGEVYGIDPDKNSQKVAKKLKLKFHLGTIHNCKFPKNSFDLVTASQVLEHENDPIRFLMDCKRFLKPGGTIILSFPNCDSPFRNIWGTKWLHWHIPYHLNHFGRKSLNVLISKSDLKPISVKTRTPNLWTILQLRSWLNDSKEGVRDPMWDYKKTEEKKNKSKLSDKLILGCFKIIESLLIINRVPDYLGYGESFVVKLKAED